MVERTGSVRDYLIDADGQAETPFRVAHDSRLHGRLQYEGPGYLAGTEIAQVLPLGTTPFHADGRLSFFSTERARSFRFTLSTHRGISRRSKCAFANFSPAKFRPAIIHRRGHGRGEGDCCRPNQDLHGKVRLAQKQTFSLPRLCFNTDHLAGWITQDQTIV